MRCARNAASAHNHDVAYVGIIFFAGYLADIWNEFAGGGEVDNVVQLYDIVATRNQCFVTAFDGYHVIGQFRSAQLVQGMSRISAFSRILAPIRISAPPQNSHHWRTQLMRMDDTISFAASISG